MERTTMAIDTPPPVRRRPRAHWWRTLRAWERAALVVVLLGALVLSAALVYFEPTGTPAANPTAPLAGTAAAGPPFPPGTRWYYQRGQWVPQDQQAPVQP